MDRRIENPMPLIFKHLAISVLCMFVGFIFGNLFIPESMLVYANMIFVFLCFALIIMALLSRSRAIPSSFPMIYVYIFTFVDGVLMYPILQYYLVELGTGTFKIILISSIIMFVLLANLANNKEAGYYLSLGNVLFAGLISLIFASVINLFISGKVVSLILSIIGVVVFSGYILFDISLIKHEIESGEILDENDLSIHVLDLYLDFINLLLDLLNIASLFDN